MTEDRPTDNLREIVSQRISGLVLEMEEVDWGAEEVINAIHDVVSTEWLPKFRALHDARQATPTNFVSDGNEG